MPSLFAELIQSAELFDFYESNYINMLLSIGDKSPDAVLADEQGNDVSLSDLWSSQPILLIFIRHFG